MDAPPDNRPAQRIAALATTATPAAIQAFQPDACHRTLAGALFMADTDEANRPLYTVQQLAKLSGLSVARIREIMQDPAACSWIISHAAGIARFGLASCYARLFNQAITSNNPMWMSMFLKRFDPEYTKADAPTVVNNTQINYQHYSDAELRALVKQKSRRYLGAEAEVAG